MSARGRALAYQRANQRTRSQRAYLRAIGQNSKGDTWTPPTVWARRRARLRQGPNGVLLRRPS